MIRASAADGALLLSSEPLTSAPAMFADDAAQREFDDARAHAADIARATLERLISVPLTGDGPLRMGNLVGFAAGDVDALDVVRRAVDASWAGERPTAFLVSTDAATPVEQSVDRRPGPHASAGLLRRLDEGWQLRVVDPAGLPRAVGAVLDEIAVAYGAAQAALSFGIRSALGGPPHASRHPRLIVQLAGARSMIVQTAGGQEPVRMSPGQVFVVAADQSVYHLPLDVDSLHLEVSLAAIESEVDRSVAAMTPTRVTDDIGTARGVVAAAPEVGWPMRLIAPGGIHVVGQTGDTTRVVVGATAVDVAADGLRLLAMLARGEPATGAALGEAVGVDPVRAVQFCEELWELGVLRPVDLVAPAAPNERLTQVASAATAGDTVHPAVLALLDDGAWRAARPGEVHHGDGLDVQVHDLGPLLPNSTIAAIVDMVRAMNAQFFHAAVTQISPHDPPLVVRVRPGTGELTTTPDGALGSDVAGVHSTRKVTFAMPLTEAAGGWIHLPAGSAAGARTPGALSAWPSFRPWTLESLAEGERLLLIGRLHGPAFR